MRAKRALVGTFVAVLTATAQETDKPRDLGLIESASTQLSQIDVTVSGPREAIEGLTAADFEVRINGKLIPGILVDALCDMGRPPANVASSETAAVPAPAGAPPRTPISYLVYLDMPHLTQPGRHAAIAAAREMVPKLLAGGNRAMLVSNAKSLRTVVPLTTDAAKIDAALDAMVNDNKDYDPYAAQEEGRLAEIMDELERDTDRAMRLARTYAREERLRQEKNLARLRMALGRLAELDAPKAVLYFADTMRQNPGGHYTSLFSSSTMRPEGGALSGEGSDIALNADTGALSLDRVINEAAANGVRFYTVEGQGLAGPTTFTQAQTWIIQGQPGGGRSNRPPPTFNTQRTRDAQGTLVGMATETGGRAFLNGVTPAKMASQILADLSCVYLLSFDPLDLPRDQALLLTVAVSRPKVKATTRGRLVVASEATRLTARVLSAYAAPSARVTTAVVRVGIIPVGYSDGLFQARVQVAVPSSPVPGTTWDMGASLVSSGRVAEDGSGRITLPQAGVPAVWEKDMSFSPGEFELVAVAHDMTRDELGSQEIRGSWPKLEAELATLGPIAVAQPTRGGFLRNGESHTSGAVVAGENDPLRPDSATAVISLVCRAKDQKRPLEVVRTLIGEGETPVGSTQLAMEADERCAQILDLIPPRTLGPGTYRYVIAVSSAGLELARGERKMLVAERTPPASAPSAPSGR